MTRFYLYLASANSKKLLISSLILMVITASGFLIFDGYSDGSVSSTNAHFHLQKSNNAQEFGKIVKDWIPKGATDPDSDLARRIRGYFHHLLVFDYLFPISYGLLGLILIARVSHHLNSLQGNWTLAVFSFPFFAAIFDLLENSFHIWILANVASIGDLQNLCAPLVTTAHLFSILKYFFLVLTLIFAIWYKFMGSRKHGKGKGMHVV